MAFLIEGHFIFGREFISKRSLLFIAIAYFLYHGLTDNLKRSYPMIMTKNGDGRGW